jgi:SAM-dependent methyltransferase/GNAT superfamily N-acetyltransferase
MIDRLWDDRRMIVCRLVAVQDPDAAALLHGYFRELVDRYNGRPMPQSVVDEAIGDHPSDDVAAFLIAYRDGEPVGCVGLRGLSPGIGVVTRMFVRPAVRGQGIAGRLLDAAQQRARALGWTALRLDTRKDLVEAQRVYRRHGFTEIPAYNDDPYADHWFEKVLVAASATSANSAGPAAHDAVMTDTHTRHEHHTWDWDARGTELILDAEASAPMVDQALSWLAGRVPHATRVLDVGSGPGVAACTLAALLPDADVLAADGAPQLLALATERADRLGLTHRVTTRQLTLPDGLGDLPQADLVWISGVVHHLPDPAAAIRALAALVRPGGVLAVAEGGLPARFLPVGADRGLAARLDVITEHLVASHRHPAGITVATRPWTDLLADAGLVDVQSRSFLLDLPAPLTSAGRRGLHGRLSRLREMLGDHASAEDRALLDTLLDEDSPEGVLRRPDAFLLTANSVHTGTAR